MVPEDEISESTKVWCFYALQLVLLGLIFVVRVGIDDIPADVRVQLQRSEKLIAKCVKHEPDKIVEDEAVIREMLANGTLTLEFNKHKELMEGHFKNLGDELGKLHQVALPPVPNLKIPDVGLLEQAGQDFRRSIDDGVYQFEQFQNSLGALLGRRGGSPRGNPKDE